MKGKALINIDLSNGERIPKDTELEIIDRYLVGSEWYYKCITSIGNISIKADLIEITDHSPYINWEQKRYEIALVALQGLITRSNNVSNFDGKASLAIKYADALIIKLKNE